MEQVTLGLIQMPVPEDLSQNLKHVLTRIRGVARRGAQIICLQELFRTRYFCQSEDPGYFELAESIPGPTTEEISRIARQEGVVVIAPIFEKRSEKLYYNSAALVDADGSLLGVYRKMHIPYDPGYFEKYYFTPGDLGFRTFRTRYARIGVLICWDQWFPEAARLTVLQGAQILFYPTAIGWYDTEADGPRAAQLEAWEMIQRGHAIANGVFVAAVNRVGKEDHLCFWGHSFVSSPFGQVIARAGDREEALITGCDLGQIRAIRQEWPFLRDRRIDVYHAAISQRLDSNHDGETVDATIQN